MTVSTPITAANRPSITPRVKEILSWYESDNPGTKGNLVRLLMTGYSEALAKGAGGGWPLLSKPFQQAQLVAAISAARQARGRLEPV